MWLDASRQRIRNARKFFRFLPSVFEVANQVAQARGFFKILILRRLFHFGFELFLHFAALAFEKTARGLDLFEILLVRDVADAWRGAVFQMRVKAMLVIRFARREDAAAAQVKLPLRERDDVPRRRRVDERAEVARAVVFFETCKSKIRDRVVQIHFEHQKSFVVAEADVVARLEFLDELAFEQQRLGFAADDVEIEITDRLDERVEFQVPAHAPAGLKILADALAQIERLADVDDRAEAVAMKIHAGLVRQRADFFADGITDWHGNNLQRKSIFGDEELFYRRGAEAQRKHLFNPQITQIFAESIF